MQGNNVLVLVQLIVIVVLAVLHWRKCRKLAAMEVHLARAAEALESCHASMDLAAKVVGDTRSLITGKTVAFRETFGIEHLPPVPGRH